VKAMAGTRAQEDLVVRIRVDDARSSQKFKDLERKMNKFVGMNKKVTAGVKRSRNEFGKFSKTMKDTKKSAGIFAGALGGIGKSALGLLGPLAGITGAFFLLKSAVSSIITAGRFAEDTITTLGVAFNSEKKGVEAFKKALDFSVVTPFDPREVAAATELAVAFGIKDPFQKGVDGLAKDVSLTQLAAGIASFSADKDINNAMKNLLVPESETIKRWGGEVMSIYRGILASGIKLGSKEFQAAWLEGLSRIDKFKKAAGAASQTVTGLLSTIGGNIGNIALMFTGAAEGKDARTFWTFFRGILLQVNNVISSLVTKAQPFLIELGAQLGGLFSDVFDIIVDLASVTIPALVIALTPFFLTLVAAFFIIRGIIKVVKFVLDLIIRWNVALFKFFAKVTGLNKLFKGTGDFFGGIVLKAKGLLIVFNLIIQKFTSAIDKFFKVVEESGPFKAIGLVIDKFSQFAGAGLGEKPGSLAVEAQKTPLDVTRRVSAPSQPVFTFPESRANRIARREAERTRKEDGGLITPSPVDGGSKTSVVVNVMPEQQEQLKNNLAPVAGRDVTFERNFIQ